LGLNIKNLRNDDKKIEIDQLTSISKKYKIENIKNNDLNTIE
jgi:hypothetical protein